MDNPDYIIVRLHRDGQMYAKPEGSYDYTDWLTPEKRADLDALAELWATPAPAEGVASDLP